MSVFSPAGTRKTANYELTRFCDFWGCQQGKKSEKNHGHVFYKIDRLKKDSNLEWHSKKSYSHFIEILHAEGHSDYRNGGYPLKCLILEVLIDECKAQKS